MKDQTFKVYIIEDDTWYGSMLQHYLSLNPEYEVKRFESPGEFFAELHNKPDVVTLDYSLPDCDGAEVLKKIKEHNPDIRVVLDPVIRATLHRGYETHASDVTFESVPDVGHWIVEQAPELVLEHLRTFMTL